VDAGLGEGGGEEGWLCPFDAVEELDERVEESCPELATVLFYIYVCLNLDMG